MAVKLFGDDMETLQEYGKRIESELKTVPGASNVKLEQSTGLPLLTVYPKRDMMARYGLTIADLNEVVRTAIGGKAAGQVFEGDRRFDIVVRLPERFRSDLEALKRLPMPLPPPAASETSTHEDTIRAALS